VKTNFITLLISAAILMAALWARHALAIGDSTHGRYYLTAILMISGIIAAITLFRWLRLGRHHLMSADDAAPGAIERHRQHYRLQFDEALHPLFVQRTDARHPVTAFTCPVRDVSETGISLSCAGVYTHGQTVIGEIIFGSGRTAPVNGVVIREEMNRTCLRLHCTIDPQVLMVEQREQIALEKGSNPRPAVSENMLDARARSLPSQAPKGICRSKRP
jgi:hypothetical protein